MREMIDTAALEAEALEQEAEALEQETVELRGEIDDLESKANYWEGRAVELDSNAKYWEGKAAEYHKELTEARRHLDDIEDDIEQDKREIIGDLRIVSTQLTTIQAGYNDSPLWAQLGYVLTEIETIQVLVSDMGGE